MGQSKGGGYTKKATVTKGQDRFLDQMLKQALGNNQQAAQGYAQFLPGGGGGEAITNAAQQNFQQQTIPSILNAFGSDSKGSSALNQALATGGANLNTSLAALLSQLQLGAAQGIGGLGASQGQLGSQDRFAYLQAQPSRWKGALQGAVQGGAAGAPAGPWGAAGGAVLGGLGGAL